MIKAQFESMGVYLPERVVSTQELIDRMPNKPLFDLESLTGIKTGAGGRIQRIPTQWP